MQRERFVVPVPGRNGVKGTVHTLAGKTFCMTGTFPELGGGAGLALGKEKAQALLESFGGRVTTCLSGVTDILLVGKEPGRAKYEEARTRCVRMMGLGELKVALEGGKLLPPSQAPELVITEFSQGYKGCGGAAQRLMGGNAPGGVNSIDHKKAAGSILAEIKARKAAKEAAAGGASGGVHAGGHAGGHRGGPPPSSSANASRGAALPSAKPARPSAAGATPSPKPSAAMTPAPRQAPPKPSSGVGSGASSGSGGGAAVTSASSASSAKPGGAGAAKDAAATFSFAPLASIDIASLKASRFLLEATRALPYRDAKGLVNLHLLRKSAADVQNGAVVPPEEVASKLRKWLSHAEKAFAKAGEGAGVDRTGEGSGKRKHDEAGREPVAATAEKMRRREAVGQ